jgi:type VI secretion system secreted protein Hcp
MAFDAFLKIEGIEGDSTDKDHKGEIEILSFSWGETNASPSNRGGGGGAGKVSMQDFHFTMQVSKASPNLMLACATGRHFQEATLTARKAGQRQQEFLKIKLSDVLVSSYQTDGNTNDKEAPLPTDQISLNFVKIDFLFSGGGSAGEVTTSASR